MILRSESIDMEVHLDEIVQANSCEGSNAISGVSLPNLPNVTIQSDDHLQSQKRCFAKLRICDILLHFQKQEAGEVCAFGL